MTQPATSSSKIVLGSRSPRRLELLRQIVPAESIEVVPPLSAEEAGFDQLHDWSAIQARLLEIARTKCHDVLSQVEDAGTSPSVVVLCADTTVVATDSAGRLIVLGQPPDDPCWSDVVTKWFIEYYLGRTHWALTGLCVRRPQGRSVERIVKTEVMFRADAAGLIPWYLATGEPRGKAGGYALQGAGSVFVSQVKGSLSNVIGLPLEELLEIFKEFDVHVGRVRSP